MRRLSINALTVESRRAVYVIVSLAAAAAETMLLSDEFRLLHGISLGWPMTSRKVRGGLCVWEKEKYESIFSILCVGHIAICDHIDILITDQFDQ